MKRLLLLSLLAFAACSTLDDGLDSDLLPKEDVEFTNGGIRFTRVTNSMFDTNDKIMVEAFDCGAWIDEAIYNYKSDRFTSDDPLRIVDGQQLSYMAVYPSTATFNGVFNISADQSSADAYEQSDLLAATVSATDAAVPELTFNHVMSSIVFNVEVLADGVAVSDAALDVTFNLKSAVGVDVADSSYVALDSVVTVRPYASVGNGSSEIYNYSLITAPQTIAANDVIANVVVDSVDVFRFVRPTDLELLSSKQYIFTFTVDVVTKESSVEFGGSINDWESVVVGGSTIVGDTLSLAEFSRDVYPTESDNWVIVDEKAVNMSYFNGLKDALTAVASTDREISLSFPNLMGFPTNAFRADSTDNLSALVAITADAATSISTSAFYSCDALTTLSLPAVKTIMSASAFHGCDALTTLLLPQVTTFNWSCISGTKKLSSIVIKDKSYSVDNGAFYNEDKSVLYKYVGVAGETEFVAPNTVKTIEPRAFYDCDSLTSVSLPAATSIGISAFAGCKALTTLSLPAVKTIISISTSAFWGCNALTTLLLPQVANLDWYCIRDLKKVASIVIKDKSYNVDNGAFYSEDKSVLYKYVGVAGETEFVAPNTVKIIRSEAFYDCDSLTSVSLPSVDSISSYAFRNCRALTSVSLPAVKSMSSCGSAFYGCDGLTTLLLPQVTNFDWDFIGDSKTLSSVVIKDKSYNVDNGAFYNEDKSVLYKYVGVAGATEFVAPNTVKTIESGAFDGCSSLTSVSLPSAEFVGGYAFSGCSSLTSVSLPSAEFVGGYAFSGCSSLTSVSLPSAESIGGGAFSGCNDLTSVSLPLATTIGEKAFYGCDALMSVSLPAADSIGSYAFRACAALTTLSLPQIATFNWDWIIWPNKLSSIVIKDKSYNADNGAFYNEDKSVLYKYVGVAGATEFVAPNTVKTIESGAFDDCNVLKSVSLPSAESIGNCAFYNCDDLTSVSLPSATAIGEAAFWGCNDLTSVSLPSATAIGEAAFGLCAALTSVSLPSATTIDVDAFYDCAALASVSLPSVAIIGERAFYSCDALTNLEIATEAKLSSISYYAFSGTDTKNIDLVIGSENDGVDVAAKRWNGHTFKSITLKDNSQGVTTRF